MGKLARRLQRELRRANLSQKDLALLMGRPEQAISEIATGKKRVTAETAMQLEAVLGVRARTWLLLQVDDDLAKVS